MYSDFKQILIPPMSNLEHFLIKENPEDRSNNSGNVQRESNLKSKNERHESSSKEAESSERIASSNKESRQEEVSSSLFGQKVREEDDGFRTPTCLVNRIPAAKQCPPPPRKPKPSLKRKASSSHSFSCRHPLDFSKEVELLLLPAHQNHNSLSDSNVSSTKKVRTEKNTQ